MHQNVTLVIEPCNFPRLARLHYSYFGSAGQWLPKLADWAAGPLFTWQPIASSSDTLNLATGQLYP